MSRPLLPISCRRGGREASALPLRHALALGLLHGPTELLPISSAGHTTLVPWLAGWPYARLDGESRKSFEVALHAGTAAALLVRPPQDAGDGGAIRGALAPLSFGEGRELAVTAVAAVPPALAGYALGESIERRLGTPVTIAAGLIAGSLAIACGEMRARRRGLARHAEEARLADGLALGVGQALALGPGVSRSGAAFAAARLRGFGPVDADRLSWRAGLPVIGGATLLQVGRLHRRDRTWGTRARLALGATGAFASTVLAAEAIGPRRRSQAMLPACAYRVALACAVFARMRATATRGPAQSKNKKASLRQPALGAYSDLKAKA